MRPTNLRAGSDPDLTEWEPPRPSVGLHTLPGTSHTHTHSDTSPKPTPEKEKSEGRRSKQREKLRMCQRKRKISPVVICCIIYKSFFLFFFKVWFSLSPPLSCWSGKQRRRAGGQRGRADLLQRLGGRAGGNPTPLPRPAERPSGPGKHMQSTWPDLELNSDSRSHTHSHLCTTHRHACMHN